MMIRNDTRPVKISGIISVDFKGFRYPGLGKGNILFSGTLFLKPIKI